MRNVLGPNTSNSLGALLVLAMVTAGLTSSCERVMKHEGPTVSPFNRPDPASDTELNPLGEFRITYYYVAHEDPREMLDAAGAAGRDDQEVSERTDEALALEAAAPLEPVAPVDPVEPDPLPNASDLEATDGAEAEDLEVELEAPSAEADGAPQRSYEKRSPGFVTLLDYKTCKPLATVNRNFAAQIAMQGTGRLANGRLINYVGSCDCNDSPCFQQVSARAKWGTGALMKDLTPFRSVAVDPKVIKLGTQLYIPQLDGLRMPGKAPWGNFVHDGCVVAEDTGGAIDGLHIDFFVAGKQHYNRLDRRHRLKSVTVYDGATKCGPASESGAIARR